MLSIPLTKALTNSAHRSTLWAVTTTPKRRRRRLPRGSLDRDTIGAASLRLLDEHGTRGFSMPLLGRELGADPSAVYRHFASKDDLILAITDRLIVEQDVKSRRGACWVETLATVARDMWELGESRPAAVALTFSRTAAREGTFGAADFVIGTFREAGFPPDEAARLYRSFVDFGLSMAQQRALLLDLDPEARDSDASNAAAFRTRGSRALPEHRRRR